MKPSHLTEYLTYAIGNHYPVLVTGAPGIGKSDIADQACTNLNVKLILSHPVVADPTDYKGLPFPRKDGKAADFLPYGDLEKLINAKEETVFFIDDMGQASTSVQAACMQLILARTINGHKVSDKVTFLAATNRKQDRAGVSGLIEPVKRRFFIQELEVDWKDWISWAVINNMPEELIAFIAFQPDLLNNPTPTTDIVNTHCPRTIANVGKQQNTKCPAHLFKDAVKGAAGEIFATQYIAFLELFDQLPTVDSVVADPSDAKIPPNTGSMYAFTVSLAKRMTESNITAISKYLYRFPPELNVCCMKMATTRDAELQNTGAFIQWTKNMKDDIF